MTSLNSVLVAQLGARMHYAVPLILEEHGRLQSFYTDFYSTPFVRAVAEPFKKYKSIQKLLGRFHPGIPPGKICHYPLLGINYVRKLGKAGGLNEQIAIHNWMGQRFCGKVAIKMSRETALVYVFNTAGKELMESAKQIGAKVILEQTIAPFSFEREILFGEYEKFPNWIAKGTPNPYKPCEEFDIYIEREKSEWQMADRIIGGSEFVGRGIELCGGPLNKYRSVPYGVNVKNIRANRSPGKADRALRVLTVGAGIRKGTPYLLAAAKALPGKVEFRLIGGISGLSIETEKELKQVLDWRGNVPRGLMGEHFEWADVFLLPSLCEGSATVTYEAFSYGLPVVATSASGSLLTDKVDGLLIEPASVSSIIDALNTLFDREKLDWYSQNALKKSVSCSIEAYGDRLMKVINEML